MFEHVREHLARSRQAYKEAGVRAAAADQEAAAMRESEPSAVVAGAAALSARYGHLGIISRAVVHAQPTPMDLAATVLAAALPKLQAQKEGREQP